MRASSLFLPPPGRRPPTPPTCPPPPACPPRTLASHPSNGIQYLALISKEIMWITMDRNGLVNKLRSADIGERAHCVLNSHQVRIQTSGHELLPSPRD